MTKVSTMMKPKDQPMSKQAGGTLVKDLLSKSMSKGGKLKAIKVKIKFGGDKSAKSKKKTSSSPADGPKGY